MKEKFTLFELLESERDLSKKVKIYSISPRYLRNEIINEEYLINIRDVLLEEYLINVSDVSLSLLKREVIKAVYYKDVIEIFIK